MSESKIPGIVAALYAEKWAIVPHKLKALAEIIEMRSRGVRFGMEEVAERLAMARDERDADKAAEREAARGGTTVSKGGGNKIAMLPLYGVIAQHARLVNQVSSPSGTSCEEFKKSFDAAMDDPDVSAVVIDVDSPGGSVSGVPELATHIRNSRGKKKIVAVANGLAASAAYWIASAADEVWCTPSGEVGSIGVFCVHEDDSEYFANEGIKFTIIKAGENKAEGNPYEPFSDDAKAYAKSQVDAFYSMFIEAVAAGRGIGADDVEKKYGQGRTVLAGPAKSRGMIDKIGTMDDALAQFGVSTKTKRSALAVEQQMDLAADELGLSLVAAMPSLELYAAEDRSVSGVGFMVSEIAAGSPGHVAGSLSASDRAPFNIDAEQAPHKGKEHTVYVADAPTGAANDTTSADAIRDAERKRAKEIRALCAENKVDDANLADDLIDRGISIADASYAIAQHKRAARAASPISVSGMRDREAEAPFDRFGDYLVAVKEAYAPGGTVDKRLAAASGMNQAIPSEGGFTVSPQYSQKIWEGMMVDDNALLPMTDNYTVEGESLTLLAPQDDSRANGILFGGVNSYWLNEADQLTKSAPKFRTVKVEPQQLATLVYCTEKLLRNSPVALEQYINKCAPAAINFRVGDAIINGSGAGQPKGFTAAPAMITVAKETGQAANTLQQENITKMWAQLHPNFRKNAVWLYNVELEPALDTLNSVVKNVAGTENVGGYANKVYDPEKGTLKGRPIVPCEFLPGFSSQGDLTLVAMGGYLTGTRGGIDTAMSMHLRFDYAELAFRFMFEVDGQPWLSTQITPYKGTKKLSTFVQLGAR